MAVRCRGAQVRQRAALPSGRNPDHRLQRLGLGKPTQTCHAESGRQPLAEWSLSESCEQIPPGQSTGLHESLVLQAVISLWAHASTLEPRVVGNDRYRPTAHGAAALRGSPEPHTRYETSPALARPASCQSPSDEGDRGVQSGPACSTAHRRSIWRAGRRRALCADRRGRCQLAPPWDSTRRSSSSISHMRNRKSSLGSSLACSMREIRA